ncbi:MAG TPA: hypothetical protein VF326_03300 [Anaerolineaceae bacterium]|jgi:heme/copper-type cytochrome/quinol oxidase subunit 4
MSRDLRKFDRQTTIYLIIGGLVLLFVVGAGLVYFIYGPESAISSLICMAAGLFPVALIVIVLWGLDWIVKHVDRD